MSCVEKRHMSHRAGSMLHHRFPNGFTDLFMDETDREVSTLTDRAFRSLCVGDDAVYNDDFLCGYSPFSCHKPLAEEPLKKNPIKESKKQGQSKSEKNHTQPWKHHQQKTISHMSSFLKALSATEESCKGMLIKNGSTTDANGESWDKTALRSIQRELSEFSSDYHTSLTDHHYKNSLKHQSADGSSNKTGKDIGLPTGKSKRIKNGKATVKLRKLNIKNFFLHSEFSPFQTWTDFNQFPFVQGDTVSSVLPLDNIPKMYELPLYKELTKACRKETLHAEKPLSSQKEEAQSCSPTAPKPMPPPQPPKVLPKPSVAPAEKRCSSDGGNGTAAPWRRNRSRATSAVLVNQPGMTPPENHLKTVDESLLLVKKEVISVEVKAVEEVSSVASTPFNICQLMTPLIPSRQPTETSEILQKVLSPSAFDLPLRPHSEAKGTPEPQVKRDSYKSLASSILFNLKDNRKRVKSRYSPPKFKTVELPEGGTDDNQKNPRAGSEGSGSGLSTPAMTKDGLTVCSPILESHGSPTVDLTEDRSDRPLSDDYLLSNLLQSKREALGEENSTPPFIYPKKNKSSMAKKQNYPSLNLYKKASPVDGDIKYLQVPQSTPAHTDAPTEMQKVSPLMLNKELSPKALPTNTGLSPNTSNIIKDCLPLISPHTLENEGLPSVGKRPPNVPEKTKCPVKDRKDKVFGAQQMSKEKEASGQIISTVDVIRAAREAINAAKNKAQSDSINKHAADREELRQKEIDENVSKEVLGSKKESLVAESNFLSQNRNELNNGKQVSNSSNVKKEPPPVPVRNIAKSDIKLPLDKQQMRNDELEEPKLDLPPKENDSIQKQGKLKYIFSARQNNYIKYQRFAVTDDEQVEENEEGNPNVNARGELDEEAREIKDSEHIINDLNALKELERARLGNRILENARSKLEVVNIDEETKAKNDLISRELRNIKRGMLSIRGNTSAKREMFAKREKEQNKQEDFAKLDSNVIVNKALINDNYDKAKMALEEIISERERKKNKLTEADANPQLDEKVCSESYTARAQQSKNSTKDAITVRREKENDSTSALKEKELKEMLSDLRDHNHLKQILAQTEPRLGESHRSGGRVALPGLNKISSEVNTLQKSTGRHLNDKLTDRSSHDNPEANSKQVARQVSEDSGDSLMNETVGSKVDTPPVPPRIKKGGNRRRGSVASEKDSVDENVCNKDGRYENLEVHLNATGKDLAVQEVNTDYAVPSQSEISSSNERWNLEKSLISSQFSATCNNLHINMSPRSASAENNAAKAQEACRIKRKAPLKPDHLITADGTVTKNVVMDEEPTKIHEPIEDKNVDSEAHSEIPRDIISPLLLVNGVSVTQSPPDQASLSSKSSYFSVESTLHNFENVTEEVKVVNEAVRNVSRNTRGDSDRAEVEYYSLSDHESEPDAIKQPVKSPQQELEVWKASKEREDADTDERLSNNESNSATLSPVNTFSPTLGIPSLFKVKDNTFSNKLRKTIQPWSPRGSLSGSERGEDELHHAKECPELTLANESSATTSGRAVILADILTPTEMTSIQSAPQLVYPSDLQDENPQKSQAGGFLTVPQEEDRFSGLSPSSEGVESLTTSTADTSEETVLNAGLTEYDTTMGFSQSGGDNESQTGLLKPPPVLPKSEKAVLKAIKLANRRIKKEEAQKSPHRSSQSSSNSSKHRAERHKADKSEHKSSTGNRNGRRSEKEHRGKIEDDHSRSHHSKNSNSQCEQLLNKKESPSCNKSEVKHETLRQDHKSLESNNQRREALPSMASERQGRSSRRHTGDKTEQRHCSSDRIISNVPVYKAHISEKQVPDRALHRTQSTDRHLGDRAERRLSADMPVNEKLDPRTQRIEKSIMDELQQRGRARNKSNRDNPLRRSHSIDAYATEVPRPSPLSRQSSHTSQLSRQSSMEHAIVTQSFPMTQRKLLQDPDSGQYFFVDVPVQVKTKTFFDPETGSYVQLPVQPPEGAVPKASPMEVLSPPLVVYHGFVPVPLSPMAPKATIQAPHLEPEDFEQRNIERSMQMYCKDAHPYLEPLYGQNEHMLGEFIGTEELDCPS